MRSSDPPHVSRSRFHVLKNERSESSFIKTSILIDILSFQIILENDSSLRALTPKFLLSIKPRLQNLDTSHYYQP